MPVDTLFYNIKFILGLPLLKSYKQQNTWSEVIKLFSVPEPNSLKKLNFDLFHILVNNSKKLFFIKQFTASSILQ